jgi:hypothetical protein
MKKLRQAKQVSELRNQVPNQFNLLLHTKCETYRVADYSKAGFQLCTHKGIKCGGEIQICEISLDGELLPISPLILPILLRVEWAKQIEGLYHFGAQSSNVSDMNREFLFDVLCEHLDQTRTAHRSAKAV